MTTATLPESDTATPAADWRADFAARQHKRLPGLCFPHRGKSQILDVPIPVDATIDTTAMSASAIISTPTIDREHDVIEPLGIKLENYRNNPVVMFDHALSGILLPIGKSEDPDGELTVKIFDDHAEATTYFDQRGREASQVFDLIAQGIVRTTSVDYLPIEVKSRTTGADGTPIRFHILECDLLEYSWCGIPINPEAIRKSLDRGKLADSPIVEPLIRYLEPFAAQPSRPGKGFDAAELVETRKAMTEKKPDAEKKPDDDAALSTDKKPDTDESDAADEGENRPGSKALHAAHKRMDAAVKSAGKAAGVQENVAVKSLLESHVNVLKDEMDGFQKCHKSEYGSEIKSEDSTGSDGNSDSESMAKAFAADARTPRQMRGLLHSVKEIGRAKNITAGQRDALDTIANALIRIVDDTAAMHKSHAQADGPEIIELKQQIAATVARFQGLMPANA